MRVEQGRRARACRARTRPSVIESEIAVEIAVEVEVEVEHRPDALRTPSPARELRLCLLCPPLSAYHVPLTHDCTASAWPSAAV